jgi:protein-L-isoaspartate(D-aspartate) O-methyltransferase
MRQQRPSRLPLLLFVILTFGFPFSPPGKNSPGASCSRPQDRAFEQRRSRMVQTQIEERGITDPVLLGAMRRVPRHLFVPEGIVDEAYDDRPLPIGYGQTISQPYIVALMTELAKLKRGDRVLEVGTGSGYQAAVLAEIVDSVWTIEILEPLARSAAERLRKLGYASVSVRCGDGYAGWAEHAPFDAIIVTAAPEQVPPRLIEQLNEGGRLVIPVGPALEVQSLLLVEKQGGEITSRHVEAVRFVPMIEGQ